MDDHLYMAMAEFVAERINFYGENEPEVLQKAHSSFYSAATKLRETLTKEQSKIFMDCEAIHSELDGETMHYYYEAGFSDAVRFIMGWKEGMFQKAPQ